MKKSSKINKEEERKVPLVLVLPILLLLIVVAIIIVAIVMPRPDENSDESNDEEETQEVVTEIDEDESSAIVTDDTTLTEEEFNNLPEDDVYIDPKAAEPDIIPGIAPTKKQALSYLYEKAMYTFSKYGIFSAIPEIYEEPQLYEEGGWYCYVSNNVGTTVLRAFVDDNGEISMDAYGSQYNKDFIGIMYCLEDTTQNPDEETIKLLETTIYEEYGNSKKLMIKAYDGNDTVTMVDADGNETVVKLSAGIENEDEIEG